MLKRKIFIELLLLLLFFSIIWAVFTFLPIFPDRTELKISVEKEEKIGEVIVEDILSNDPSFKEIKNSFVDSTLLIISNRLINAVGNTKFDYKIIVLNNPDINAFALPGGYIFIYSGLIEFTDKPEELAAVIAHEMGHIEKRHLISKLIKELGVNILFSGDIAVLGEVGKMATSTVFDRKQEREADKFALETLHKATISPIFLATFFRRLSSEHGSYNENLEILMTHPHNKSRIKAALEYELEKDFVTKEFDIDWKKMKLMLKEENNK